MFKVGQHWCHNSRRVMRIDSVRISHNPNYADIQGVCAHGSNYSAVRTNPERHALFGWVLLNDPKVDEVWTDRANPHNLYRITWGLKLKCLSNGVTGRIKGSMLEFHARCKYAGVMPKVGDTWGLSGASVSVSRVDGRLVQIASTYSLDISDFLNKAIFICRAKLTNIVLATGDKEPIKASAKDHRFTSVELHPWQVEAMAKVLEYCNKDVAATKTLSLASQRKTIWRSRKGRYVTLVGVTPKVVHLRDTLTDEYVGFRNHADFLRTYERVLTKGEQWVRVAGDSKLHVIGELVAVKSVSDGWVYNSLGQTKVDTFLKRFVPTPDAVLDIGGIKCGASGHSIAELVKQGPLAPPAHTIEVGSFWKHKKKHITEEIGQSVRLGHVYLKRSQRSVSESFLTGHYDPIPKGLVAAVRAEANAALKAGELTLTTKYGKEFMLRGKGSIIEFCRAVLEEADKCQPST